MKDKIVKISDKFKKLREGKLFFPIVMNLIVMLLLVLFFYARYQSELDIIMQALIYGTGNAGEPTAHMIFSNIILGAVLSKLAGVFPNVAWYTLFHYVMAYVSMVIISRLVVKNNVSRAGKVIATIISIFIGYECYISPMYMKTAILLTVAAVILLAHIITGEKHSKLECALSIVMLWMASLVSFKIFLFGFIITASVFGVYIFFYLKDKRNLKQVLIMLGIVIGLSGLSYFVDQRAYSDGSEWGRIGAIRDSYEDLFSFGFPDYAEIEDALMEQNYTYVDANYYKQMKSGFYYEFYDNTAAYNFIAKQHVTVSPWKVLLFFHTVPLKAFKTGMFYLWLILAFIILYKNSKRKEVISVMISLAMVAILYFIRYFSYGYENQMMGMIAYMPAIAFLIYQMRDITFEEERYAYVYLGLTGLVLYYIFAGTLIGGVEDASEATEVLALDSEEPEYLYLIDFNYYMKQFSIYTVYPRQVDSGQRFIANNIYSLIPGYRAMQQAVDVNHSMYRIYARSSNVRDAISFNAQAYLGRIEGDYNTLDKSFHKLTVTELVEGYEDEDAAEETTESVE